MQLLRLTRVLRATKITNSLRTRRLASLSTESTRVRKTVEVELVYSGNRIINDFIKLGNFSSALKLFDEMSTRDAVTYNLIISIHGKSGIPKQGFYLYREMVSNGIRENAFTLSSVLSICGVDGLHLEGILAHSRVVKLGLSFNLFIACPLVGLYMHMGVHDSALKVFDELPARNLATWNSVLRGLSELCRFSELLESYCEMRWDGVAANALSFCYLIHGCSNEIFTSEGLQLHCQVIRMGWVVSNVFVSNALIDFYSACNMLEDAKKSFEAIHPWDVISWNSVVSLYVDNGLLSEASCLFRVMQAWGNKPSVRTFVRFLNYSSMNEDMLLGKQIHCFVLKTGHADWSVHVQSALIDMYGKCNYIDTSLLMFQNIPEKTLVCYNSLMTSFLHCHITDTVLEVFCLMVVEGIGFDGVTISTTLSALMRSKVAGLASCGLVQCCAIKSGFESDISVSCSLINLYSSLGHVSLSYQIFTQIQSPNVICFTSIINGFSQNGMGSESIGMFKAMVHQGVKPDEVALLCVLSGCSHSGLVEEGRLIFYSMKDLYGISPGREHIACMIDLLGRAGLLDEAEAFLQLAPIRNDCKMLSSLLRSCRVHGDEMAGRRAAEVLLHLSPSDAAIYLQVANFYSEIGEFTEAAMIRDIAVAKEMSREIGHSLIYASN